MKTLARFFSSLTTRLQITTLFMSVVGIMFSCRDYFIFKDRLPEISDQLLIDLYLQIGIALLAQLLAWLMISWWVIRPLVTLIEIMRKLGNNDYHIDIPYVANRNQIGSFARKVKLFKDSIIYMRKLEEEQVALKVKTDEQRKALMQSLSTNFDANISNIVQQFQESAGAIEEHAEMLSKIASESNGQLQTLLQQSLKTSDNISSVSGAAEELTASIRQISQQVSGVANVTKQAVSKAGSASTVMQALSKETNRISEVLSLITEITHQINLLALNASIEAARAGEAGKGFSVVASEVKNLAAQSATATQEIGRFINTIGQQTQLAVASIEEIHNTIQEINSLSAHVTDAMGAQDSATRHIAQNIQDTATLASESRRVAGTFSTATQQINTSAAEMLGTCTTLTQQSSNLDVEVARFLATMREA